LDFDNACLVRYTVRQSDLALGPSSDIHRFLGAQLCERGYKCLGTTSDDEYGTHLTYWYILEFCGPKDNPNYNPEEDDWDEDDFMDGYDEEEY
jgi:hypothetical protein